jgi:predicted RND superfamily exporter protein
MKSIGFGIERIAWAALDRPRLAGVIFLAIVLLAGFGLTRVKYDQDLRNVFSGQIAAESRKIATAQQFVDPENETVVLVEGKAIAEPAVLKRLQDFQFELQLLDNVDSVYSLFSLRDPPNAEGAAPLLVGDPALGLTPERVARIRTHPILGAKLLTADADGMVFVVTPIDARDPVATPRKLNTEIEEKAKEILGPTGLSVSVSGFPAIRVAIIEVLKRDQLILNGAGAVIGFLMSLIAFRSFTAAIMTAVPAIVGALIVIGGMGLLNVPVTVMSNVVPALVMILGYADGMHISHAWRHHRDHGASPARAERLAQQEVGAACVLTAITVSIAFLSLSITDIAIIRDFAFTGAVAMIVGCLTVLVAHAFGALLIGRFWKGRTGPARTLLVRFEEPCARLGRFVVDNARPLSLISIVLFVVMGAMYFAVPPEHSVSENLPADDPANMALQRFDANFGGAYPVEVVVPLNGEPATAPASVAKIRAVHQAVAAVEGVDTPLSLWSLVDWLGDNDPETLVRLEGLVDEMGPETRSRFLGSGGATLVTANIHEAPNYITAPLLDRIEAAARAAGGEDVVITGSTVVTNRESTRTISNLNFNLATAIVGDIIIMVIAFRHLPIGIVSVFANTLPLFATGALLFLLGRGMQMTSVIALTVAFGIAVDDTIHYINRFLIHTSRAQALRDRLIETSREVGPVLIGTTLIVICGLSTTLTSGLPTIALFGWIAAVTLVVAVVGDLIVMPALIYGVARRWFDTKPAPSSVAEPAEASAPERS